MTDESCAVLRKVLWKEDRWTPCTTPQHDPINLLELDRSVGADALRSDAGQPVPVELMGSAAPRGDLSPPGKDFVRVWAGKRKRLSGRVQIFARCADDELSRR